MQIPVDDRKIWWIASYPKSGNTWVRMFLNAYMTGFPLDINSSFQYALGDNHLSFFQACYCRPANQLTATEQVFLRPAALMIALHMSAAKHLCLKTHHAKVKVDDIPLIPPKISAGSVYIVRDPRDVAISMADHMGESIDYAIESMGEKQYITEHKVTGLMHVLTTWSLHVETWTDKNKDVPVKIIRYEDMLERPEYEFVHILEALGITDIDEEKFEFALEQTEFKNLRKTEEEKGFRELGLGDKFFRVGKSGQWKTVLTPEQIDKIETDHGVIMEKFGYEKAEVLV